MYWFKKQLKKIVPEPFFLLYHRCLAYSAALFFFFPSQKMIIIGITGTKGKTTTANYIWSVLNACGIKCGLISSAAISIGEKAKVNDYHMTMPGRLAIQSLLNTMLKKGCRACVLEVTSEGIKQYRHKGIYFDIAVFTNLSPEHLPSHEGSFDKYRQAKEKLFSATSRGLIKKINDKVVPKALIVNTDDEFNTYFSKYVSSAAPLYTYGIEKSAQYKASIETESSSVWKPAFLVNGYEYQLSIAGFFNIYNALPAIIVADIFKRERSDISHGVTGLTAIPGRMEVINEGQPFTVIVDYAHEKQSMTALLKTAQEVRKGSKNKNCSIFVLLGAEGGGRDKSKRPAMGHVVGKEADYVFVTNVDPYEDNAKEILEDIALAARLEGKVDNQNLFLIEDRKSAIEKALSMAQSGDIVLVTGKGAEQSMIIGNKEIPWDDRVVVKEILHSKSKPLGL